jgi:hypothetical protein
MLLREAIGQINMAHFCEIRTDNNEVIRTVVINDADVAPFGENSVEAEQWVANNIKKDGWLNENVFDGNYPETYWKRTSYNTVNNQHILGGTPFRGNGAGPGCTYDATNDVFWPVKEFDSWIKDLTTASWKPPIAFPAYSQDIDGVTLEIIPKWDEPNLKWIGRTAEDTPRNVEWDSTNTTWNII